MVTFLVSNLDFQGLPKPGVSIRRIPRLRGIPDYSFRILPLFRERQSSVQLPPDIIRHIVGYAVRDHGLGWRATLLTYGLVSKAWSCVYQLFFDILTYNTPDMATATAVAHSLEMRPERGHFLRSFSPGYFDMDCTDEASYLTSCQGLVKILSITTSVREVYLTCIHSSALQELKRALSKLRKVDTLRIRGGLGGKITSRQLSVDEIQTAIAPWSELRSCKLSAIFNMDMG